MPPVGPLAGTPGGAGALTVPQAMQDAIAAYQRGDLVEAERRCRLALEVKANYFDALYLSGIIAAQTGRTEDAARLLSRAVMANPRIADAHYNWGVALGELVGPSDAHDRYASAFVLKPYHPYDFYHTTYHCG